MTLFWILTALLVIAAIAILTPTLLRGRKLAANDREAQNIAIARERLAELDVELAEGQLSAEEHAKAKLELEQALLQDIEGTSAAPVTASDAKLGRFTLIGLLLAVPLIAVTLYLQLGSTQMIERAAPGASAGGMAMGNGKHNASLAQLAVQLRQRLEKETPDDAEGWYLLGRTYMSLKDYTQAVQAFDKALQLAKDDPVTMLALADALAMQQQGNISGRPAKLVDQALAIEPNNPTALWMSGLIAEEQGYFNKALKQWEKLYPMLANEPSEQKQLAMQITRVAALAGVAPPAFLAQKSTAAGKTTGMGNTSVKVKVTLSAALQKQVQTGDSLFIYAKAMNGPRFPLAAARRSASELPLELTLDESSAVMPNATLANFATVKVGARVSHSGNAIAESGDLIGEVENVQVGSDKTIEIVIDKVY